MSLKASLLVDLYVTFAKIGSVTFGGGVAMLPILERELIDKKKWMTSDEMLDYYAISQSTPGIIAVNVATFIGHKQAGTLGGIVATMGIVTPSLVIISLIAHFIGAINHIAWVRKGLMGINIGVAANLTYATINMSKKTVKNILGAFLFIAAFILIFFLKVSTIYVIFGAAAIGIVYALITGSLELKKQDKGLDHE
ncbi:MAG: chromate transporter [Treponema sp.]|nr:chromate transporter [Treponema sp.]